MKTVTATMQGILFITILFLGCSSTQQTLTTLRKNVEEERLTPAEAVRNKFILEEYDHLLPPAEYEPLSLHLLSQNKYIAPDGGRLVVQLGLSTQAPAIRATHIHCLVDAPGNPDTELSATIRNVLTAIDNGVALLPSGSTLSVDTVGSKPDDWPPVPALITGRATHEDDVMHLLRPMMQMPLTGGRHHFILFAANHKHKTASTRQDLVDLARFLSTRHASCSILLMGDKPEFGLWDRFANMGQGRMQVLTEGFDANGWLKSEMEYVHAAPLEDISIAIQWGPEVRRHEILPGTNCVSADGDRNLGIPSLRQGQQRAILFALEIDGGEDGEAIELLKASVDCYDSVNRRYYTSTPQSLRLSFARDRNKMLYAKELLVERSLLLIRSMDVIQDAAAALGEHRPYQAMALLSEQSNDLKDLGGQLRDDALLKDADVLDSYIAYLYQFSDQSFQGLKTWRDLTWDSGRFVSRSR